MRRLATLADVTGRTLSERPVQRGAILALGLVGIKCVHVPNGAHLAGTPTRRAMQMQKLKADGLRVGFPDLVLFDTRVERRVGFIEVKAEDGGNGLSDAQIEWEDDLVRWGFPHGVIYLPEQALDVVKRWGWR